MSHYDEVYALLQASGFTLHAGHVPPLPTYPYGVLWWPGVGRRQRNSLSGVSGRLTLRFRVTSVGLTDASVRVIAAAFQAAVLDRFVVVPNWVTHQILHSGTDVPIQEDRDVTMSETDRHPLYTVDAYRLAAEAS